MLFGSRNDEIKVCLECEDETPLIWTFKFNGYEYWCPCCGYKGGMLGAGYSVRKTRELEEKLSELKAKSKEFLSGDADESEWKYEY